MMREIEVVFQTLIHKSYHSSCCCRGRRSRGKEESIQLSTLKLPRCLTMLSHYLMRMRRKPGFKRLSVIVSSHSGLTLFLKIKIVLTKSLHIYVILKEKKIFLTSATSEVAEVKNPLFSRRPNFFLDKMGQIHLKFSCKRHGDG